MTPAKLRHYTFGYGRTACGIDITRPQPDMRYATATTIEESRVTCPACREKAGIRPKKGVA